MVLKILFLNSKPNVAIYSSYYNFMKILLDKNIEFYLHTTNSNDIPYIIEQLENIIDKKKIITDINDIKNINITHIFYKVCYHRCFTKYVRSNNIKKIFKNSKICFYNYGYSIVDHKYLRNIGYNSEFFDNCDYFFTENKLNNKHYQGKIKNKKIKFFDIGSIKLSTIKNNKINTKNDFFYIMWCPRWTKNKNRSSDMCSYEIYVDYFINLVNVNSKIKLIFRPHPLTNYSIDKILDASKINPRIIIDKSDYYYDTFQFINVFVSDPSTMIAEAFNFLVPIIYTITIKNVFTEFGNEIEKSFYTVKNINEINIEIKNLLKNNDSKKKLREKYHNEYYKIYKNPINKLLSILDN